MTVGVKFVGKFLLIAVFCTCAAVSLLAAESRANAADAADAGVKGLWIVCEAFPDDAETVRFAYSDDDEVFYSRYLPGGRLFIISRTAKGKTAEPREIKRNIEKRVENEGGDPDEIQFDMTAEEFSGILGSPCMLALYKTDADDEQMGLNLCVLSVFTDEHTFVVALEAPAGGLPEGGDDEDEYDMGDWFRSLKLVDRGDPAAGPGDADESPIIRSGLEKHEKSLKWYKRAEEFDWYGETSDADRVRMAGELLEIFGDCGVNIDEWTPNTLAQRMNDYYDQGRGSSIFRTAADALNVDPELFD
jgi:hypothetical protein